MKAMMYVFGVICWTILAMVAGKFYGSYLNLEILAVVVVALIIFILGFWIGQHNPKKTRIIKK